MTPSATAVQMSTRARLWRDFLDVLLFARQNRAKLIVPDNLPVLPQLIELKENPGSCLEIINKAYHHSYKELRAYRGAFDNLSSLLTLKEMHISSGRHFKRDEGERYLIYSFHTARNHQLEQQSDFLALALHTEDEYVGTKIFMRAHMLELISL